MIEIEAEILRGSCTPVYFVGETIECEIRFKCVSNKNKILTKKKRQELELEQDELKRKDTLLLETQIDNNKIDHIKESMFSILSTYPSQMSSPNSSLPGTPNIENNPILRPSSSKSFNSFLGENLKLDEHDTEFTIAWACAQIDCNGFIDESKVVLPKDPLRYNTSNDKTNDSSTTSFIPNKDRVGISLFSSKPKILFCNLTLRPNEVQTFIYKETLPYDLVPTFRGQFARYAYKLTIGIQKLNRNTQLLRLPFRVYSLMDFEKYIPKISDIGDESDYNNKKRDSIVSISDSISDSDSFEFKEPPNPFKIEEKTGYENLEYALQILEDLTARMSINHYNVTNQDGKIVKITLNKTNYKIGDKIVVILDFSEAQIPCVEYKVTLQSEEIISEECRKKSNQTLSSIHSHVELKEHSLFIKKNDFTIQIPVNITPTFVSDIISLRWRLHFDFALSKTYIQKIQRSNDSAMSVSWRPPNSLQVEITSWDLPIVIHPFDPFTASDLIYSNANNFNESNSLTLK